MGPKGENSVACHSATSSSFCLVEDAEFVLRRGERDCRPFSFALNQLREKRVFVPLADWACGESACSAHQRAPTFRKESCRPASRNHLPVRASAWCSPAATDSNHQPGSRCHQQGPGKYCLQIHPMDRNPAGCHHPASIRHAIPVTDAPTHRRTGHAISAHACLAYAIRNVSGDQHGAHG
jgi:hypothetical protein